MNVRSAFWISLVVLGGFAAFSKNGAQEALPASPPSTFKVIIIDSLTQKPVSGVTLSIKRSPTKSATSDLNGELIFSGLPSGPFDLKVSAEKAGYCRWWSQEALGPWQKLEIPDMGKQRNFDCLTFDASKKRAPVVITVEKGVTIKGKVLDPSGVPIENATVAVVAYGTSNTLSGDSRFSVRTKSDGTYTALLPASGQSSYNLMAHDGFYEQDPKAPGRCFILGWRIWANGSVPAFKTTPGQVIENMDIFLNKPYTIKGRVINKLGQPVVNHKLRALPVTGDQSILYTPSTSTNSEGIFDFNFVPEGIHCIQTEPYRVSASGKIKTGDTAKLFTVGKDSKNDNLEFVVVDKSTTIIRYNPNLELEIIDSDRYRPFAAASDPEPTGVQSIFIDTLIQALETKDHKLLTSLFWENGTKNSSYIHDTTDRLIQMGEDFADIEITIREPNETLVKRQAENPAWLPKLSYICVIRCDGARIRPDSLKENANAKGASRRIIGSSTSFLYLGQAEDRLLISYPQQQ